jgi:hypothetical protein
LIATNDGDDKDIGFTPDEDGIVVDSAGSRIRGTMRIRLNPKGAKDVWVDRYFVLSQNAGELRRYVDSDSALKAFLSSAVGQDFHSWPLLIPVFIQSVRCGNERWVSCLAKHLKDNGYEFEDVLSKSVIIALQRGHVNVLDTILETVRPETMKVNQSWPVVLSNSISEQNIFCVYRLLFYASEHIIDLGIHIDPILKNIFSNFAESTLTQYIERHYHRLKSGGGKSSSSGENPGVENISTVSTRCPTPSP